MKTKVPTLWKLAVLALVASFTSLGALAADIIKTNNAIALNLTNSWVGDVVPTGTDVAVWDATVTAARSAVIGGNIAFQGIRVTNVVTGLQTIGTTASSQLSLGSAGIDLSGATVDMTISAVLNYVADQPWSVASGRTLLLSGANVGSAAITASGTGTLKLGHASAFGTSAVTLGGGLTVGSDKATGRAIANNVTLNGDIGITSTSTTVGSAGISGTLQFNGGINLGGGNRTISLSSTTATAFIPNFAINSAVTNGNLYITNTTPGTAPVQSVVISGTAINCNFGLRLGAGVDVLTTASATLNPAVKLTLDAGSTFQMSKAGTASTYSGGYNQTVGSLAGDGIIAAQGTAPAVTFTVDDSVVGVDSAFAGTISSGPTTAISLIKAGGNTLTLSGANSYTGTTTLSNGTLRVSGSGTFGAVTAPVSIRAGILDINSTAQTVGAVTMYGGSIASTGGSGSLTGASYALYAGDVSAVLAGSGAVTKATVGTVTLTGANSYTGATTVSSGTLLVNSPGSLAAGSAVSVSASTELGGSGTINGPATVGGLLSPGNNGLGTLTFTSNLTLSATASVLVEINTTNSPATNDYIVVGGTFSVTDSTLTVTNLGPDPAVGSSFKLFSQATAGFTNAILPALPGDRQWNNNLAVDGSLQVVAAGGGIPNTPTNLTFNVSGSALTISWPPSYVGWILQAQTNALNAGLQTDTNAWHDLTGTAGVFTTNLPIDAANANVFYRLRHP